jgi:2-polyprenyl-3-methyl-5-hydroxy-6-metoxy-1,4-benzoquinol methylase
MDMADKKIINARKHWEQIYSTRKEAELSWFQPYPKTSVAFIESFSLPLTAAIIDIGGGDSRLVDILLDKGFWNVSVLDISSHAIERAKKRLGEKARNVHWIVSDITEFKAPAKYDLWHDRAALHFLTREDDIRQYVAVAENAIRKDGYLVVGSFSEQGPTRCSGLEIKQYSEDSLAARFQRSFRRVKCITEDHITPSQAAQNFLFCGFQKI